MIKKNTTFILFGATGDLSKRKLLPALYQLIAQKKIENILIIGAAFDNATSESMINAALPFIKNPDDSILQKLYSCSYYKKLNFNTYSDFVALKEFVLECEQKYNFSQTHRLFYVATASHFFTSITQNSFGSGLLQRTTAQSAFWHRIIYEKPFGHDAQSARAINECIANLIDESQVYRIDHYLTKEVVSNIAMIRFTNCVLEPLWSNRYIDQVQIVLSETLGLEGRGSYYDAYGALKDVVQNHILEILALVCMEAPEKLIGDAIRNERVKVLQNVRFIDGILGQYDGYLNEKDVGEGSHTETYAFLKLAVDTLRWRGVPFYIKTGKCLDKKETVIHIKFKQVDCLLLRGCPTDSNWLTISVDPESIIQLTLNVKKPLHADRVVPVVMELAHNKITGVESSQAYEVLLLEVLRGEQSISVRFDEIEYAWKLIDHLAAQKLPLYRYEKGSEGPVEEIQFIQKHGIKKR